MNNIDEFEGLIKNFKLDDIQGTRASGTASMAFDYEEDHARYEAAQEYARTAQPTQRAVGARASKESDPRRSFEVNINDSEFYEAPTASHTSPKPLRGGGNGGGGTGGGGNNRRDHGRDQNDGDDEEPEYTGGSVNRWIKAIVVLGVVLGVSIFLAFFALESASDLFGLNKPDGQIEIQLADSQSMSQIATMLKSDGVITQPLTFQIYAGLKNKAEDFIPGTYVLNSNMSYDEIMVAFRSGSTKKVKVMLLFYEGMTLADMADKLEENRVCTKKELFEYLDKGDFPWEYKFLESVPDDELRFRQYEGYFFPDTYEFYEDMSPTDVTRKFFSNFNNKIGDELYAQMEKMNMTLDDTMKLASIIQREVGNIKDMGYVSSVFHNRLNNPQVFPNLQSDTTREYVETDIKPYVDVTNQPLYDAYNSDMGKRVGLPAGPICNPGLDAIQAALNPTPSDYYFFVTDIEGTCYYAKTDAEHEQNKAIAKQKGETHGINIDEPKS